RDIYQRVELSSLNCEVACAGRLAPALVNAREREALFGRFVHDSSSQIDILELHMNLNIFRRVTKNLGQQLDRMIHLAVTGQDFSLRNLSDHKCIVKDRGTIIERPSRADDVGRISFDNVGHTEVVQPLKVQRFVGFQPRKFFERVNRLFVIPFAHCGFDERVQRGDQVVILANPQKDLGEPLERAYVIYVSIENAAQKVNRLVLLALGDENFDRAVDLLRRAIEIANLKEPAANLEQVVITILVQLNKTEESPLGIVHHSGGKISASQYRQQFDIPGVSLECFAEDVDCAVGLSLLRVNSCDSGERQAAIRIDDNCFQVCV